MQLKKIISCFFWRNILTKYSMTRIQYNHCFIINNIQQLHVFRKIVNEMELFKSFKNKYNNDYLVSLLNMENIDFIIREDGENKVISGDDNDSRIDVMELLEHDYDYIFKTLNDDKYNIRIRECDYFKELLYKGKVVGFVTYDITSKYHYTLTNIYILSGYRRNRLLFNELKCHLSQNILISIYEPTRQVVEALIRYNWAKKITKNLVVSAINFNIDLSQAISNKDQSSKNGFTFTNIYDLGICAAVSLKIFNKENYEVYYTQIHEDDKRFNCEEKRENIDNSYFDKLVSELIERDSEIERWLFLLNKRLPSKPINTEEIIGKPAHFSQTLQDNINDKILTLKEAKLIQNQLFLELRTGKVEKEALQLRLDYLIDNYHEKTIRNNTTENYCPYCYEDVDYLDNYCINCGYTLYNLSDMDEEEFVYKRLLDEKQSYKFSLTGKRELKNYFDTEYLVDVAIGIILDNIHDGLFGDDIFDVFANRYGIHELDLEQIMIDRGYIIYKMNSQKWEDEAYDFKNVELKEILKQHNCKVSGNKYDLIQRIKKEVPLEDITSSIPSLTEAGINFLHEHSDLFFHNTFLKDFIFEEFKEYLEENRYNDTKYGTAIDFLDKHIEYARRTKNHDQLVHSLRTKSNLFSQNEYFEEILETELEVFMINLNMIYLDSHYYSYYKPIDQLSWLVFYQIKNVFTDEEFTNKFNEVFQSFDEKDLIVSVYDTIEYLQDVLRHYNLGGINRKISHKYYRKREYKKIRVKGRDNTGMTTLDRFFK